MTVQHEKIATQKSSTKIVQHVKRATRKDCNIKRMQYEKKCNLKRVQQEKRATWK